MPKKIGDFFKMNVQEYMRDVSQEFYALYETVGEQHGEASQLALLTSLEFILQAELETIETTPDPDDPQESDYF